MKKKPMKPNQMSLMMYMVVGGYLMYIAWDLRDAFRTDPWLLVFAVLFGLVGAALLGFSIYKYVKKEYTVTGPFAAPKAGKDEEAGGENREDAAE